MAYEGAIVVVPRGGTQIGTYSIGDLLYASGSTTLSKLAIGGSNTVLHGGTIPSYSAVSLTADVSGILPPSNGGTGTNNGSSTLTLGGNLVTSGAFPATFTITGITNVTFPTSGTLATTGGSIPSITGTANQVLVNGTSGSPVSGSAITLTTPQSIGTSSAVQFASIGLGGTAGGSLVNISDGGTDTGDYASLQIVRAANGHVGSHISLIRVGQSVAGIGYGQNTNIWGLGAGTTGAFDPNFISIDPINLQIGIGTATPQDEIDLTGNTMINPSGDVRFLYQDLATVASMGVIGLGGVSLEWYVGGGSTPNFDAAYVRDPGANGVLEFIQRGTGGIYHYPNIGLSTTAYSLFVPTSFSVTSNQSTLQISAELTVASTQDTQINTYKKRGSGSVSANDYVGSFNSLFMNSASAYVSGSKILTQATAVTSGAERVSVFLQTIKDGVVDNWLTVDGTRNVFIPNGYVSIGTPASAPSNTQLRVKGTSTASTWVGRGSFGGDNAAVILGEYDSTIALLGGHNAALNAWYRLYVNVDSSGNGEGTAFRDISIGSSYRAIAAPSNGLIVQGGTGIGTSSPSSDTLLHLETTRSIQALITGTQTSVNAGSNQFAMFFLNTMQPTNGASGCFVIDLAPTIIAPSTKTITKASLIETVPILASNAGTIDDVYGLNLTAGTSHTGTVTRGTNFLCKKPSFGTTKICAAIDELSIGSSYNTTAPPANGFICQGASALGATSVSSGVMLEIISTTGGLRLPNMTTTQKNALANVAGNTVWDTNLNKMCVNTGAVWQTVDSS